MSNFKSIQKATEGFYSAKGSKFYAHVFPIQKKEQVKALIESLKEKYPKANHFCYAFSLGVGAEEYHLSNDDGEPGNSAGSPILGQIKSFEVSNVLIVVVRFFGGTKLGVGGLIAAYKQAAKSGLEKAEFKPLRIIVKLSFEVAYPDLGKVLSIVDRNNLAVEQSHGANSVKIQLKVPQKEVDAVMDCFSPLNLKIEQD